MDSVGNSLLRRLGAGESIASICQTQNWTRSDFDAWWKNEAKQRAPNCEGTLEVEVDLEVKIERDRWGIPHILAKTNRDLWRGLGFAMAQDRLFQMDYLRRKATGRLSEVLGREGLPLDRIARTVGLNRIARAEVENLPRETVEFLEAFSQGVNAWIQQCGERLPVEFVMLDYHPERWTPFDSVAIENEFRWYLTGRFPVIVMPELAKRVLGDTPLYRELLLGEADDETIVPPEAYQDLRQRLGKNPWQDGTTLPRDAVGQTTTDPEQTGSNNWVVAGKHCRSGKPMVASDPHIAIDAVSCWYQAHLCGGEFNVAGIAYAGMPAIMFGRNEQLAWGITNNICSQRDLYQEQTDPAHPGCFLFNGEWEPAREVLETIVVKGENAVSLVVRYSRNGPVVDEILPHPGNETGPVSLKWLGAYRGGWLTALLDVDRARSIDEFRSALKPWHVPTFNMVVADQQGNIAVQCAGRIPLRNSAERGCRRGWLLVDQWQGLIPFDHMPHAINPARGWLVTANNRLAQNDYPYPLFGTWVGGYRAQRIRQMIEQKLEAVKKSEASGGFDYEDFRKMHYDTLSLRAVNCVPPLLAALADAADPRVQTAADVLKRWDCRVDANKVAPTLFNVFFTAWSKAVAHERFSGAVAELLAKQVEGLASRLLHNDPHGWFAERRRVSTIQRVFQETLSYLAHRLGEDITTWQWGRLHILPLKHVLSGRGDLGQLLDHGNVPVDGDVITVCNTGTVTDWQANTGAGYRLIADLSQNCLLAMDCPSQSGNPGSSHYSDQLPAWLNGEYHTLPLDQGEVARIAVQQQILTPKK